MMCLPCSSTSRLNHDTGVAKKSLYLDVYAGMNCPSTTSSSDVPAYCKTDVAQDGCTVLCRSPKCYKIGTHRCAACEREAYCSEECRRIDISRHREDCQRLAMSAPPRRLTMMKQFNRQAPCHVGSKDCTRRVVSFCRHCQATVCQSWKCSKLHLEQCQAYLEARLQREWVMIVLIKGQDALKQKGLEKYVMKQKGLAKCERGGKEEEEEWLLVEDDYQPSK